MSAYYNEWEPYPAQWLRNLIAANLIAPGDVDERSINDIKADDLRKYTQCHFFAGIGGWSYALRLAGWDDQRPVWTGSCPCQPFACSGKRQGHADDRHLWPSFYGLIAECKPSIIFGEQVASKDGREWLSAVRLDLEDAGYAVGAANLSAASVGAPHERQRHFFVADTGGGQQRQEVEGRKSRNGEMESLAANGIGADATGRHTNGWRIGSHEEMEKDRPITYCHEARRADGQMESRLRASEVALNRCAFVEEWQGWNGGFSGFGRVDDGVSSRMAKSVVGGFGNAIVPQVAQAFIEAFMEVRP